MVSTLSENLTSFASFQGVVIFLLLGAVVAIGLFLLKKTIDGENVKREKKFTELVQKIPTEHVDKAMEIAVEIRQFGIEDRNRELFWQTLRLIGFVVALTLAGTAIAIQFL